MGQEDHIQELDKKIGELEKNIQRLLDQADDFRSQAESLCEIRFGLKEERDILWAKQNPEDYSFMLSGNKGSEFRLLVKEKFEKMGFSISTGNLGLDWSIEISIEEREKAVKVVLPHMDEIKFWGGSAKRIDSGIGGYGLGCTYPRMNLEFYADGKIFLADPYSKRSFKSIKHALLFVAAKAEEEK
jgi:hypothetical protein